MAKKPAKPVKSQAKAKKPVAAKPKATAKAAKPVPTKHARTKGAGAKALAAKAVASKAKPEKKAPPLKPAVKSVAKIPVAKAPAAKAAPELKAKAKAPVPKAKKTSVPSVMGSKPKKDADEMEDEFLDDDIEIDPELAEFVDDVAELEEVDAEAQKALAGGSSDDDEEEEVAAPLKKTPKEKSASERRIKKERDLLSGIDRNGDLSEIWQKFFDTHKNEKAKQYNMRETFEAKSSLQHVKLGWGFILSNINDRLEVLFKEGIKILISNYKS